MQTIRFGLTLLALAALLSGCAANQPAELARETASFLILQAGEEKFVQGCSVGNQTDLECKLAYEERLKNQQRLYAEQFADQQAAEPSLAEAMRDHFESDASAASPSTR